MYLAIDPSDNERVLLPVVGLPFADYERVRDKIVIGSELMLVPVDDNPYDPKAVEVRFQDGEGDVRIGFVPRDAAPGVRLALGVGALHAQVRVGRDGERLAVTVLTSDLEAFIRLASQADARQAQDISRVKPEDEAWPFRAYMPGEERDPQAPADKFGLMLSLIGRLRDKAPDSPILKAAVEAVFEEWEDATDDHLFDVSDAVEERLLGVEDDSYDAACARDKIGGLPYCEAGWNWPCCPTCGQEMVFLGQSRDPANLHDLIQAFWCVDTIENECDADTDSDDKGSTVRIWRNPAAISPLTIRPNDESRVLCGHRLVKAEGDDALQVTTMTRDGIAHTHFNQCTYEEGRHRVFEICLDRKLFGGGSPEQYTVLRHGRGLVTSWEDWGG
jgi:hypothetical protein